MKQALISIQALLIGLPIKMITYGDEAEQHPSAEHMIPYECHQLCGDPVQMVIIYLH